jgi:hypothetical protein
MAKLLLLILLLPTALQAAEATKLPGGHTQTDEGERGARQTAIDASLTLKVAHPDQVRHQVLEWVKQAGGYPTLVSDARLDLRVPPQQVEALVTQISQSGLVLARTLQRNDRTEVIADLQARLRTKRDIFHRLRAFLDDSNVSATLKVERSMTALVTDLERLRGELEVEEANVRNAAIRVTFQFHQERHVDQVVSPFAWLNTLDLEQFMGNF